MLALIIPICIHKPQIGIETHVQNRNFHLDNDINSDFLLNTSELHQRPLKAEPTEMSSSTCSNALAYLEDTDTDMLSITPDDLAGCTWSDANISAPVHPRNWLLLLPLTETPCTFCICKAYKQKIQLEKTKTAAIGDDYNEIVYEHSNLDEVFGLACDENDKLLDELKERSYERNMHVKLQQECAKSRQLTRQLRTARKRVHRLSRGAENKSAWIEQACLRHQEVIRELAETETAMSGLVRQLVLRLMSSASAEFDGRVRRTQ